MRSKSKNIILLFFIMPLFFITSSCEDMLETDSNRLVFDDDYQLIDPDNPFYAISGILAKLQKIGDRYVLFGELRGDLMTATNDASVSLKEINDFEVSPENEYINKRDFYDVINNCNYALQRLDTTFIVQSENKMIPIYAEILTIRSWTYFQMAQIYGKVAYFTNPILDYESSVAQYPTVGIDELVDILINDLQPYRAVLLPSGDSRVPNRFITPSTFLGDLYLYQNRYREAAQMYYFFISSEGHTITRDQASIWASGFNTPSQAMHYRAYDFEAIAKIQFDTDPKNFHSKLINLSFNLQPSILPSRNYVDFMSSSVYYHANSLTDNVTAYREGDLRGNIPQTSLSRQEGDAYAYMDLENGSIPLIYKYFETRNVTTNGFDPNNDIFTEEGRNAWSSLNTYISNGLYYLTQIPIYRTPHLYLRFAEALNRAEKPTLAFAVLKYGLTSAIINDTINIKVNQLELGESFTDFGNTGFDSNFPMAARGRGLGISMATDYNIPDFTGSPTAKQDSIEWVEDRILEEMAAETPFEGNRFFDLLRVSSRRPNHPEYMAEKVSLKYDDPAAMKAKLMNKDKWFMP